MKRIAVAVLLVVAAALLVIVVIQWLAIRSYQHQQLEESGTRSTLFESLRRKAKEPKIEMALAIPKFLSLPFPSGTKYKIARGWDFDPEEQETSLETKNWGIDFDLPSGTAILAPADGYALASYHEYYPGFYRGEPQIRGLGTFVQIYHPQAQLYSQCAYLSKLEPKADIPYLKSQRSAKEGLPSSWIPWRLILYLPPDFDLEYYHANDPNTSSYPHDVVPVEVKRGQVIGYVTDGKIYQHGGHKTKAELHFEVFTRSPESTQKALRFDPYGIYADAHWYGSMSGYANNQEHNLWVVDEDGRPLCADSPSQ